VGKSVPMDWRPESSDYGFIAAVVFVTVLCVGVYLAPTEVQDLLKVRHGVFNPFAYLTASFVHGDVVHLTVNLVFSGFLDFCSILLIA
jgi:membrane associated rhomboid family serine protease